MANLTPEAAAMRAYTVQPLSIDGIDDVHCVRRFMSVARTLEGCDHEGDERVDYAETLLRRWIKISSTDREDGHEPHAVFTLEEAAYDAATLAYWLWTIEPKPGETFCDRGDISSGWYRVVELIDKLLLAALGLTDSRPHLSTLEKFEAAQVAYPRASVEQLYATAHRMRGSRKTATGATLRVVKGARSRPEVPHG